MADPDQRGDTAGAPAWLKAAGIILLLAVVLAVVVVVLGGAGHVRPSH